MIITDYTYLTLSLHQENILSNKLSLLEMAKCICSASAKHLELLQFLLIEHKGVFSPKRIRSLFFIDNFSIIFFVIFFFEQIYNRTTNFIVFLILLILSSLEQTYNKFEVFLLC